MIMINMTALCLALVIASLIIKWICKEFIPNTAYKKHINNFMLVVWLMYLGAMSGMYLERGSSILVTPPPYEYGYDYKTSERVYLHGFIHGVEAALRCPEYGDEGINDCTSRYAAKFNGTGRHEGENR